MTPEHILADLADHLRLPALTLDEDRACALVFDDGLRIELQILDAQDKVRLLAHLGTVNPDHAHDVLLGALVGNVLMSRAVRAHISYEPVERILILSKDVSFGEAANDSLAGQVSKVADEARRTRSVLTQQQFIFS